jgi:hypothetical protein
LQYRNSQPAQERHLQAASHEPSATRVSATTFAYLTVGTIARVLLASDTAVTAAGSKWDDAVKSGANLFFGMQTDDRKASFFFKTNPYVQEPTIQTVQSSHDGDMKEDFINWGCKEDEA